MHLAAKSARSLAYGNRPISLISQCTILQQKWAYVCTFLLQNDCGNMSSTLWDMGLAHCVIMNLIFNLVYLLSLGHYSDVIEPAWCLRSPTTRLSSRKLVQIYSNETQHSAMLIICKMLCDATVNFPHTALFSNAQRVYIHYKPNIPQ